MDSDRYFVDRIDTPSITRQTDTSQMLDQPTTLATPERRAGATAASVRTTYRGLRRMGWSETEASSMAAHLAGLTPSRTGWQLREVERLLFIRSLVDDGRIAS